MNYSLRSSSLSIEITKTGVELCSIKSIATGLEYIWQADPKIWGSHAPVLFPIIGSLKDGFITYKDQKYAIPKHGMVRNSDKLHLIEATGNSLRFSLVWDTESLQRYPFKFAFEITYTLTGSTIEVSHHIINKGDETMYYSVGGHPAFNCPLFREEKYEDYYLEFSCPESDNTWLLDNQGLLSGQQRPVLENSSILPLHNHLFDNDALIFKNLKSRKVYLKSQKKGAVLSLQFDDFDYLGIWAKPAAPFVCIEPWLGITDSSASTQELTAKDGIRKLEVGKSELKSYAISIIE